MNFRSARNHARVLLPVLSIVLLLGVSSSLGLAAAFPPAGSRALGSVALPSNDTNTNYPWNFPGQNQQNTWNSPQTMINPYNVGNLTLSWSANIPHVYGPPVVVGGVVYVNAGGYSGVGENGGVYALNETSGQTLWDDDYSSTNLNFTTRGGVAVNNGSVFAGTQDSELVSLDALTGRLRWEVPITQGITGNPVGYYIGPSGTPLVFKNTVIIADTQGDVGARGFIRAFDASNGSLLWTWYVVPPSPITSDNQAPWLDTWGPCTYCGGGDIWNLPALDPAGGIVYFGTGNPAPDYNSSERSPLPADTNLYTDCVVALNATTGNLIWYYQENKAESHDWDQGMPVMLYYTTINGSSTEVLGAGGKDGYFFELDARNGTLYHKIPLGMHMNVDAQPTPGGTIVYPGSFGGINSYYSYDPFTGMVYVLAYNQPSNYTIAPIDPYSDVSGSVDNPVPGISTNSTLYAIDASSGAVAWSMNMKGLGGGVSTTNDLVFTSDGNGILYSLDAMTGKILWSYYSNADGYLGFVSRTPPSVTDGFLFESLYGTDDGGLLAFTTNTSVYYPAGYPSTTTTITSSSTSSSSSSSTTTKSPASSSSSSSSSSMTSSVLNSTTTSANLTTTTLSSKSSGPPAGSSPLANYSIVIAVLAILAAGSSIMILSRKK